MLFHSESNKNDDVFDSCSEYIDKAFSESATDFESFENEVDLIDDAGNKHNNAFTIQY